MRVKVAECAALFWDSGKLVWDDYLHHRQLALTSDSERVVRWFSSWRELDSAGEIDSRAKAIAEHLLDAGILIEEESSAHKAEVAVLRRWRPWGAAATHYHFASRTLAGTPYLRLEDDDARQRDKLRHGPAPTQFKNYDNNAAFISLSDAVDDDIWPRRTLVDALRHRRSVRQFAASPLSRQDLATILQLAAGVVDMRGDPQQAPAVFKTSPSAGARDPIELYVCALRIDGIAPGLYHFSSKRHGLENLAAPPPTQELLAAVGGQPWLTAGAALVLYTAVIERSQWRYETGRAYRDVLLGLGHLSQTVLLLATAMGIGSIFATAVCDEHLESLIALEDTGEVLLGVTALGHNESESTRWP